MSVYHGFVSTKPDGADSSLVKASDWNSPHVIGSGNVSAIHPFVVVTMSGPGDGGDFGIATSGTSTAGIQEAVNSVSGTVGAVIYISPGLHPVYQTINIPALTNGLSFLGGEGYNKTSGDTPSNTGWGATHIKSHINNGPLFIISGIGDTRSAFGIVFRDIFFEGPGTTGSTGLQLSNLDTGRVQGCTMNQFGTAILLNYVGTTLAGGEQPGKLWVLDNEFAEGQSCYVHMAGATQNYIRDNIFESFGPFTKSVWLQDTNKTHITNNEFDPSSLSGGPPVYIEMEQTTAVNTSGRSNLKENLVRDNWIYCNSPGQRAISIINDSGATNPYNVSNSGFPYNFTSVGNHILIAYNPRSGAPDNTTGGSIDPIGVYNIVDNTTGNQMDPTLLGFVALDSILGGGISSNIIDEGTRLPANVVYQNIFTACYGSVIAIFSGTPTISNEVQVLVGPNSGSIVTTGTMQTNDGAHFHDFTGAFNGQHQHAYQTGDSSGALVSGLTNFAAPQQTDTTSGVLSVTKAAYMFMVPTKWFFMVKTTGNGGQFGLHLQYD